MKRIVTISSDKDIMGGEWCIDGTRIPASFLLKRGVEAFLKDYPWTKESFGEQELVDGE